MKWPPSPCTRSRGSRREPPARLPAGSPAPHRARFARVALGAVVVAAAFATAPPAAADLNPRSLRAAADYSAKRRGRSLLVLQHGKTVYERYPNGGGASKAWPVYSGTKAFWAVAAIAATQDGWLRLDERVSATIAEWRDDPRRKDITARELLDFTSGLDPNFPLHSDRVADRNAAALRSAVVAARGKAFTYGPSHGQVLCELLRRKLAPSGEKPLRFLHRRVLAPLDIGGVEYRADRQGNPLVASGFRLTARQWSRLGLMLLGRGRLGTAVILREEALEPALQGSRANPCFGFALWLNRAAGHRGAREVDIEQMLERPWQKQDWRNACICRDAPPDLFAAVGSGHQRLWVIPSLDLVVVRQGEDAPFSDADFLRILLRT